MRESSSNAYHPFVRRVTRGLRHRCGVSAKARIVVATSGGADSTALLHALTTIAPKRGWNLQLAVGHVQHHLRDEAEADAAFVADLAAKLELPYLRADLDLPTDGNVEANARRQRYDALGEMARVFEASFVATAHHGDDQLETMLMRLLRGASARGLGAMAWRRAIRKDGNVKLIRPMLSSSHDEAIGYLRAIDQPWREDHTNHERTRLRAHLRAEVLPPLKAIDAHAGRKAARMSDHLRDVAHVIEQAIDRAADHVMLGNDTLSIDRNEARQMPRAVLTGLLRRLLIEAGAGEDRIGHRALGAIARAARDGEGGERRFHIEGGISVTIDRAMLKINSVQSTSK